MDPEPGGRPSSDPNHPPDRAPDPASTVIIEAVDGALAHPAGRRPHCLVLVPGISGVATPTVAAGLALALASVQPADVLLADLDSHPVERGTGLSMRFGLYAPEPGAMLPVAPRLTYRPTRPDELADPWPQHFGLMLVHCGPSPTREALDGALAVADSVLLFTPDSDAGTEAAGAALGWLCAAERAELARGAVVVLGGDGADAGVSTEGPLADRCRAVHRLPAAAHLVPPGVLDPELIPDKALDTLLDLVREVLDDA